LLGSVDPGVKEVVVAIWKAFSAPEELTGSSLVELSSLLVRERHVYHVEVTIFSVSNPLRELVSLNSMNWPVPGILRLDNIEAVIKSKCHDTMSRV